MSEQVLVSFTAITIEDLRRFLGAHPGHLPLRDHIKQAGLQVSLIKTDQGEVLEIS